MITDFRGKTAFITGGASGIGLGMARPFGRAGIGRPNAQFQNI